jgi:hypothetical protein
MHSTSSLRYPVVRIVWGGEGRITGIGVGGRPSKPFPGSEGSHTTAWAVLVDTVRRALVGCTLPEAAGELELLIGALDNSQESEKRRLPQQRGADFDEAANLAYNAMMLAAYPRGDRAGADLQTAIGAYLTARNLAPLANAYLGPARAIGHGEPAPLRRLRQYEQAGADGRQAVLAEELREDVWALLDDDVINYAIEVGHDNAAATLPGGAGLTDDQRVREIVGRHLLEIAYAYPIAYRDANLDDPTWTAEKLGEFEVAYDGTTYVPQRASDWPDAPLNWSADSRVHAVVKVSRRSGTVKSVRFHGRANTLLNTQGNHVTANVLVEQAVRRQLLGKHPRTALSDLHTFATAVTTLPTFPKGAVPDPKLILVKAQADFFAAADAALEVLHDQKAETDTMVYVTEELAVAYLSLRSALPLAAVQLGSPSNGRGEGYAMDRLAKAGLNRQRTTGGMVCWDLWRLFDHKALAALAGDGQRLAEWAPGASANRAQRVQDALEVHFRTVEAAFPELAKDAAFRSVPSLQWLLATANVQGGTYDMGLNPLNLQPKGHVPERATQKASQDDIDDREYVPKQHSRQSKASSAGGGRAKSRR